MILLPCAKGLSDDCDIGLFRPWEAMQQAAPAGDYRVVTDEELIEGLSFPAYRRVSTMIFVPASFFHSRVVTIDPLDLKSTQDRDAAHQVRDRVSPADVSSGNASTLVASNQHWYDDGAEFSKPESQL